MAKLRTQPNIRETTIVFGDGDMAALWNVKPSSHTVDEYEFEFLPTEWMIYNNEITNEMYDRETGKIIKRYAKDMCINLSASPNCNKWLLLCNFNGKETDLIKNFDLKLLRENQNLRKELKTYRAINARLHYQLNKFLNQPDEWNTRNLKNLEIMKNIIGTQVLPPNQEQPGEEY